MKRLYKAKNFADNTLHTINEANAIIEEYVADGLNLTLRQLYYQFVARKVIMFDGKPFANEQRNYDKLGRIISDARLAGLIDWDAIVDRTRQLESNSHWSSVRSMLRSAAAWYKRDLWRTQPVRLEVWIEKQALTGIIERPCMELDVPYFACRGYVSQSEQRVAGLRALSNYEHYGQQTIILHLGDHDPSGMDMTRDNNDRLAMFASYNAVDVKRIALNMDQILKHKSPPNPTKVTDSRAPAYIEQFGYDSWELDALDPRILDKLVRKHINHYVDDDLMSEAIEQQEEERQVLWALAGNH